MRFFTIFLMVVLLFLLACKKKKNALNVEVVKTNKVETDQKIVSPIKIIPLRAKAKKAVENWLEYQNIAEFIPQYYKTTTKESLFNSQRLAELTQQLKDTIRADKFNIPSFRIRLHVLNNIALRLADMDSIPSITNNEIIKETHNITNAFNAVNDKINFIINKEQLELDLKEFDHLFKTKDTIKEIKALKKIQQKRVKPRRIQPLKRSKQKRLKKKRS